MTLQVVRLVVPDAAVWLSEYVAGLDSAVPPNDEHYGRVRPAFTGPIWQEVRKVSLCYFMYHLSLLAHAIPQGTHSSLTSHMYHSA